MRIREPEPCAPRRRRDVFGPIVWPAFAASLLLLGACGRGDEPASEAELAKAIEREIPPGPDRSPEDRRAAAAALARDATDLAAGYATMPEAVEPETSPEAIMARECDELAAAVSVLRQRIESPTVGEQLTPEERAALPEELAQFETRYAETCR